MTAVLKDFNQWQEFHPITLQFVSIVALRAKEILISNSTPYTEHLNKLNLHTPSHI